MIDNQNRDLEAVKRHFPHLAKMYQLGSIKAAKAFENKKLAEWTEVEGYQVLRVGDSNYVRVPVTDLRNPKWFWIINLYDQTDIVCQLSSKEVYTWLFRKGN